MGGIGGASGLVLGLAGRHVPLRGEYAQRTADAGHQLVAVGDEGEQAEEPEQTSQTQQQDDCEAVQVPKGVTSTGRLTSTTAKSKRFDREAR